MSPPAIQSIFVAYVGPNGKGSLDPDLQFASAFVCAETFLRLVYEYFNVNASASIAAGRTTEGRDGRTDGRTQTTDTFRNSSCCDLLRCPSARMLRVPSSPLPPISRQIVARCSFARRTRLLVYRGAKRTYERRLRLFKAHPG